MIQEYMIWTAPIDLVVIEKLKENPGRLDEVLEICAEHRALMTPAVRGFYDSVVANKPKPEDGATAWLNAMLLIAAIDSFQDRLRISSKMT